MEFQFQKTLSAVTFLGALIIFQTLGQFAHAADEKQQIKLPDITLKNGGRNGPNTSGESISEKKDAGITEKEILKGTYDCSLRFAKSIYENILKREATIPPTTMVHKKSENSENQAYCAGRIIDDGYRFGYHKDTCVYGSDQNYSGVGKPLSGKYVSFNYNWGKADRTTIESNYFGSEMTPGQNGNGMFISLKIGMRTLESDPIQLNEIFYVKSIPFITYEKTISNPKYDDYGRIESSDVVISDWDLILPADLGSNVTVWRASYNNSVATKITANTEAYANCLAKVINP